MLSVELVQAVARLRRNFPRNADVLLVCEALERGEQPAAPIVLTSETFDRRAYQRDYMRKRRAKA